MHQLVLILIMFSFAIGGTLMVLVQMDLVYSRRWLLGGMLLLGLAGVALTITAVNSPPASTAPYAR